MSERELPNGSNIGFVEELYLQFLADQESVSQDWAAYFSEIYHENQQDSQSEAPPVATSQLFQVAQNGNGKKVANARDLQDKLMRLVRAYRKVGHLVAKVDPLGIPRPLRPELFPSFWGISDEELDCKVSGEVLHFERSVTLREVVERLEKTYCRSIGVQYMHIEDLPARYWLERRVEESENQRELSRKEQLHILEKLTDAVVFEEFIQKKYVGAKSFSLEGGESFIPLMHQAIEELGRHGVREIVLAMAHRGRLNVLANVIGKPVSEIFREFDDEEAERFVGQGDVKYHLGHSCDYSLSNGEKMHVSLCFNPSHLEFVSPVALGRLRSKQDRTGDKAGDKKACILVHGDAVFAGEGIVQETLNLSELSAYKTGGTVHVIINNQIGFTTSPHESRSSMYCSDVAKMLEIPIFHVNGEDPEAVSQVIQLAVEYRSVFKKDVLIDMYSYRRRGHNEGDEPTFTQPVLYRAIKNRKTTREGYLEHLLKLGGITNEEADAIHAKCRERLEEELEAARKKPGREQEATLGGLWRGYCQGKFEDIYDVKTGVPWATCKKLIAKLSTYPESFTPNPKIKRLLEQRSEMGEGTRELDWGMGELLAYATLATTGTRVRMTGQDAGRGTFSHRHSALADYQNGELYFPLRHLSENQADVQIFNSALSESAVLGYEYGYSLDTPDGLIIWEAQFGDFANVAQVIFDQFICSAEEKWKRYSGITVFLPHGFEGMGPEHSSARLERYLELCAQNNMQVVMPSTPAQMFHLLRRQVLSKWRKPLIVMTPKSLLRHPKAVSSYEDFEAEKFELLIQDKSIQAKEKVKRVLLCSGKIYYELIQEREKRALESSVAILRLEQLYPLSMEIIEEGFKGFAQETPVFWVQEEPENMGAWRYLKVKFGEKFIGKHAFYGVSRREASSPATGSKASHVLEQTRLLNQAFEGL